MCFRTLFIVLFVSCLSSACSENIDSSKLIVKNDLFVKNCIERIKNIYGIEEDDFFFYQKIDTDQAYWALNRLSNYEPKECFSFGRFRFGKYLNSKEAFNSMSKLVKFVQDDYPDFSNNDSVNSSQEIIFGKGGSTFILIDNYIIEKSNRCKSSYEIAVTYSDSLRNSYYPNGLPNHYHYVRYCCACSNELRMTIN